MELKPGYKMTEVGVIPEDWEVRRLEDVAEIISGGTPKTNEPSYWDGNIKWCTPTDITGSYGKYLLETERTISQSGLKNSGARLLPAGTLLLCSRATIGELMIAGEEVCTNQGFKSLVCIPGISNEFLYYKLLTMKQQMIERAFGSTFLEISKANVAALEISLPPLPEQRAIAEALSDADNLIEALDRLIAKKRDLKQAAMQELLTGKTRLPGFGGEWEVKRLGEVAGINRMNIVPANQPDQLFVHFSLPAFDAGKNAQVELGATIGSNKFRVPLDAVLVSKLNPRIPRIWAPVSIPPNSCASTEWLVLTPLSSINRAFLYIICSSSDFCQQMEMAATGTTGSHQRISPSVALDIYVTVPTDINEQTAIAEVLSDMDGEIAALEARRDKTRALKQGMMAELLTGKTRLL